MKDSKSPRVAVIRWGFNKFSFQLDDWKYIRENSPFELFICEFAKHLSSKCNTVMTWSSFAVLAVCSLTAGSWFLFNFSKFEQLWSLVVTLVVVLFASSVAAIIGYKAKNKINKMTEDMTSKAEEYLKAHMRQYEWDGTCLIFATPVNAFNLCIYLKIHATSKLFPTLPAPIYSKSITMVQEINKV